MGRVTREMPSDSTKACRKVGLKGVNWILLMDRKNTFTRMTRVLGPLAEGVRDGEDVAEGGTKDGDVVGVRDMDMDTDTEEVGEEAELGEGAGVDDGIRSA